MSHCVKCYGHLCQFYHCYSLNMVMSRDPGFKFRKFLFFAYSIVNFRKIWGQLAQEEKSYRQKQNSGWKTHLPPPPVLIGLSTILTILSLTFMHGNRLKKIPSLHLRHFVCNLHNFSLSQNIRGLIVIF